MTTEEREELAIITEIGVGIRDRSNAFVWFNVHGLWGNAFLGLSWEDAQQFIETNDIQNLADLKGKPIVVGIKDYIVHARRMFK